MIKKIKSREGFTLIELLVVIIILGILIALGVQQFGAITEGAERRAVESNLRTIDGAIMMYRASEGEWLVGTDGEDIDALNDILGQDALGDYLDPFEPTAQEDYEIRWDEGANRDRAFVTGDAGGETDLDNSFLTLPWRD